MSSSNAFVSSAESVRLHRQMCSSPVQNVLGANDQHVHDRLQWDSYLEMTVKDYLVASDEYVRLQCEIIFGGE